MVKNAIRPAQPTPDLSAKDRITIVEEGHKAESKELRTPYQRAMDLLKSDEAYRKDLMLGNRVGFYKVHKEIGAGNFSKVKLASHILTKERVALKCLYKNKLDAKGLESIMREAENMRLCRHPNLITIFEVMDSMSKLYMAMELAEAGDLYSRVVDEGPLAEPVAQAIFAQVVSALQHMHSQFIYHRDIKAENVFFSSRWVVKLGDLGFSTRTDSKAAQLRTFCGSPPYAAPELFSEASYVGQWTDIWALGVLLYFTTVGVTPFRGDSVSEMKASVLRGEWEWPVGAKYSEGLRELVGGMLQRRPEQRTLLSDVSTHHWLSGSTTAGPWSSVEAGAGLEGVGALGVTDEMLKEWGGQDLRHPLAGVVRISVHRHLVASRPVVQPPLPPEEEEARRRFHIRSKVCVIL